MMDEKENDWQQRQRALIGDEATEALRGCRAALIGLGGVGGGALEALVRAGVGHLLVMDFDVFSPSNRNRQLLALKSETGRPKTEAAARRAAQISSECELTALCERLDAETVQKVIDYSPDFVIDAIDNVTAKLLLVERCREAGVPLITCLGTGNRLDAQSFKVGTAADTAGCACPLARVMRRELRKRNMEDAVVLYSTEQPRPVSGETRVGSVSWVPPSAGFALAGHMIREFLKSRGFEQ